MGLLYKDLQELSKLYTDKVSGAEEVSEDQTKGYVVTAADKKANTPAWQGYKKGVKSKVTGKPLYRAADHLKEEEVEVDESIGSAIDKGLSAGADVAKVAGKAAVGGVKVASKVVKKTAGAAGRVAGTAVGAVKSAKKGYKGGAAADEEVKIDAIDHYLNELKKVTYASYAKKATTDLANRSFDHGESEKRMYEPDKEDEKEEKKQAMRKKGIDRAIDKLAKEDVDVVERLLESGKFSTEEIANIADLQEADIADILARLEKKRISKGGDPEESPLPAMRKYHADKKKKAKK